MTARLLPVEIEVGLAPQGRLALLPLRDATTSLLATRLEFASTATVDLAPTTQTFEMVSDIVNFAAFRLRGYVMTVSTRGVQANVGSWLRSARAAGDLETLYNQQLLLNKPQWGSLQRDAVFQTPIDNGNTWDILQIPGLRRTANLEESGDILIRGSVRQFTPVEAYTLARGWGANTAAVVEVYVQVMAVVDVMYDEQVEYITTGRLIEQMVDIPGGTPTEKLEALYALAQRTQAAEDALRRRPRRRK